jgi:hypothetical protein
MIAVKINDGTVSGGHYKLKYCSMKSAREKCGYASGLEMKL